MSLLNSCALKQQDPFVAGISGGMDSVVLLDVLVRSGYRPLVAHFNHQIRPQAAADAEFVRQRAEDYGLDFVLGSADVTALARASGQGIEEAARCARYIFLFKLAEERGAVGLVVAHQADDQVETVLMNLLRGSGLSGLTGMRERSISPFNKRIPLMRPLLSCWREEIQIYCRERGLTWVEDETNQDPLYRRNRIRLDLLPELESYNPQIKNALFKMADLLTTDMDFLRQTVEEAAQSCGLKEKENWAEFDQRTFQKFTPAVQRSLIRKILAETFAAESDLGAQQVEIARRCLNREVKSLRTQLNDMVEVRVENTRGVFIQAADSSLPDPEWPNLGEDKHLPVSAGSVFLSEDWEMQLECLPTDSIGDAYLHNEDNFCAYLAMESLEPELVLRTWREGDRYQPLGMREGQQKVSDFWVNNKVPLRAKRHWPLFFSGSTLVWIPGFPPADCVRITSDTRQILKVCVRRKN